MIEKFPGAVDHLVFGKHTPNTRWFYYGVYVSLLVYGLFYALQVEMVASDWASASFIAFAVSVFFNPFDEGWQG